MVAHERIKCADIEEELRQIRQEKEALRSAMRIIEQENALLKGSESQTSTLSRPTASSADLTPRSSRPTSGAGLAVVSPVPSPTPVPESPDRLSSSPSPTHSPPIADQPTSPASPEVISSVTSVPTRKDSVPQKHAWTVQEPYTLPKSPVPNLPEEVSPWAG